MCDGSTTIYAGGMNELVTGRARRQCGHNESEAATEPPHMEHLVMVTIGSHTRGSPSKATADLLLKEADEVAKLLLPAFAASHGLTNFFADKLRQALAKPTVPPFATSR